MLHLPKSAFLHPNCNSYSLASKTHQAFSCWTRILASAKLPKTTHHTSRFYSKKFSDAQKTPLPIRPSKNQALYQKKLTLKRKKLQSKYDVQGTSQNLRELGYYRLDKMLIDTGLTTRSLLDRFLRDNELRIEGERMTQPDRIRRFLDPNTVTVNGQHIPYLDPISVALYKPKNIMSYQSTKTPRRAKDLIRLQNEGYEELANIYNTILPEEFQYRRPPFVELAPLQPEQTGLQILSQKPALVRKCKQSTLPLKRVYIVEVESNLTGLELDAFKFFRADSSGVGAALGNTDRSHTPADQGIPMPDPQFEQLGDKVAKITLFDGKPDNLKEILIAVRHAPVSIHRVGFGGLSIKHEYSDVEAEGDEFRPVQPSSPLDLEQENDWIVLNDREERDMVKELKHRKEWLNRQLRTQHLVTVERERRMKEIRERMEKEKRPGSQQSSH